MRSFDAIVVGGGIVGCACAASLSSSGLKVALIEAEGVAFGSTSAGMGHIVVMDDSEAQFALTKYSQDLWKELAPELPAQAEFDKCGTIWIAGDETEMAEARRKRELYLRGGVSAEILDEKTLIEAEPQLKRGMAGGLRVPGDSVIYQLCAAQFLMDRAESLGSKFIKGKVISISDDGVTLANGDRVRAGATINSAGAAAGDLSPDLKIVKRKGHLVITDRYPDRVRHQLVELGYLRSAHGNSSDSVAFNVQPRNTGQLIIGSSRQIGKDDRSIDHDILRRMTARAFDFMPALRKMSSVRVWTGFRPATPDNLPYIGRIGGYKNVYAAAGHEGLGITTSLGTAELVTAAVLGREPAIPIMPYSPERHCQ
jgi:glycine/D-amino acid oxidase-like deaminating enzyme